MISEALEQAKDTWQEIVKLTFPLFADMPIKIGSNPKSKSTFSAYTNNKTIVVNVNDPSRMEREYDGLIVPNYQPSAPVLYGVPRKISDNELGKGLAFDNFFFIFSHELYHPRVCPNSKEDQKKISKSLYDGIKEAEPNIPKRDVFFKVNNSKNLIWDVVVNLTFLSEIEGLHDKKLRQRIGYVFSKNKRQIDSQPVSHFPNGIVPIAYLTSANDRTTDIPISLVGSMYTTMSYNHSTARKNAMKIFLDDLMSKRMDEVQTMSKLKEMYLGFVSCLNPKEAKEAGIDFKKFKENVQGIENYDAADFNDKQKYLLEMLTKIFETPSLRYDALKGFVKTISEYIPATQKVGSFDPGTTGYDGGGGTEEESDDEMDGGSMPSTLDDLSDQLDEKEMDDLLDDLSNNHDYDNDDPYARRHDPQYDAKKQLALVAADEFYKKNAEQIDVKNPYAEAVSFDAGMRKKWRIKKENIVTKTELSTYNTDKIISFQEATGLPALVKIGDGYFRVREYELVETKIKSHTMTKAGIEIPENWIPLIDSSSSMTGTSQYVGSENKYDILMRVLYGIEKGLCSVCKMMSKDVNFGVVNFSDVTHYSGTDSLTKIFESRNHKAKTTQLQPQKGNTRLNNGVFSEIKKDLKPGKTVYSLMTDGDIQSDTTKLYNTVDELGREKNTAFVYIEIGEGSPFGEEIQTLSRTNNGVLYYRVKSVKEIKQKLSSVLITYSK
jgi:hypothetical protein